MKKLILFALLAISTMLTAQNTVTDSTVTVTLPTVLDLTNLTSAFNSISLIVSAIMTFIFGFWAKGSETLKKYLPTTEKRVAVIGLLSSLVVAVIFGFNKDAVNLVWQTLLGVLGAMGLFGVFKPTKQPQTDYLEGSAQS